MRFSTATSCDQTPSARIQRMSDDDLQAELARLPAENERLKGQRAHGASLKVSEQGSVSVYGMGRFPITLYKEPWLTLLDLRAHSLGGGREWFYASRRRSHWRIPLFALALAIIDARQAILRTRLGL